MLIAFPLVSLRGRGFNAEDVEVIKATVPLLDSNGTERSSSDAWGFCKRILIPEVYAGVLVHRLTVIRYPKLEAESGKAQTRSQLLLSGQPIHSTALLVAPEVEPVAIYPGEELEIVVSNLLSNAMWFTASLEVFVKR